MTFTMLLRNLLLLGASSTVYAAFDLGFPDDTDLTSFVSRPEIKAPLFNVTVHDASRVTPGYWFVAPYAKINQDSQPTRYYQACQTGPAIYDGAGQLVWTGACQFKNQNGCDFRASRYNGTDHLSTILYVFGDDRSGHGVVLNDSYGVVATSYPPKLVPLFNMHELNIIEEGRTGLAIMGKAEMADISVLELEDDIGWVHNLGFREFDVATGETRFEWWALDHVPLNQSDVKIEATEGPHPRAWNWFHMNSVDKSPEGDYMISSRYTDCIYKISGNDGHVMWRLGGRNSSFVQEGFNFSRQHDARFIERNATTEIISFLDNASDDYKETSTYSSALIVALDTSVSPMVATVIRRWIRPDEGLSRLRGNFQLLPNKNAFIGWSGNSYITEHTYDGDLVMEAQFVSRRFVTYRAYKFNFTGNPSEPPVLKVQLWGTSAATSTSVLHVSWNGATEVATWEFHRGEGPEISDNSTSPSQTQVISTLIGRAPKTGFETMFQFSGFESHVYAEAISASGKSLGRSLIEATVIPDGWVRRDEEASSASNVDSEPLIDLGGNMPLEGLLGLRKDEL